MEKAIKFLCYCIGLSFIIPVLLGVILLVLAALGILHK